MNSKTRSYILAASFVFAVFAPLVPAQAGQLLPPQNVDSMSNPPKCQANSALVWSTANGGSVVCTDVSGMVSTKNDCGPGKMITSISDGKATCVPPSEAIWTTVGVVNYVCVGGFPIKDPNPEAYSYPLYSTTCASRYCSSLGYVFGLLTEVDSSTANGAFDYTIPYNSPSGVPIMVNCTY